MIRNLGALVFGSLLAASTSYAEHAPFLGRRPWLRCVSAPPSSSSAASTTTTASPSNFYGFIFQVEPNNSYVTSADTYLLTPQGFKVKQVGHAEVQAQSPATLTGSILNIQYVTASPATFTLASTSTSPFGIFNATVSTALFGGQSLVNQPVICKVFGPSPQPSPPIMNTTTTTTTTATANSPK